MPISRRDTLKLLGSAASTALLSSLPDRLRAHPVRSSAEVSLADDKGAFQKPSRPVTAITLGAGNRGNIYGGYATKYPQELNIVGVAEPISVRNERYARIHNIQDSNRFKTWEDIFQRPKFADAVLITTPDRLHYGPCIAALHMGYDILLEKPVASTAQECRDILALTKKTGRVVGVCHVLRYAPYFIKLRELIQSGAIGELVSIQHLEPIEHEHMAHSFVRGNWHDRNASTPIILAKSCHDLDILRWIVNKPCQQIVAMGNLKWFKNENAPVGSTDRCMDGCVVENTCPYSALKIYVRRHNHLEHFDLPEAKGQIDETILSQLRTTNYGRCVYRMDNNQDDHYVCSMQFEGGITANFSMEAFTSYEGRRTRVMGSMGDIVGDMSSFTLKDFRTDKTTVYDGTNGFISDSHGGGDWRLVRDWIQAVSQHDINLLTSTIDASIESHLMGFMAEQSRRTGKVETVRV